MFNLLKLIRNQKGQSIVETAYLLPLLIAVIYAGLEVANIYNNWTSFRNAARTGCAILSRGGSDTEIKDAIYENVGKIIRWGFVEFQAGNIEIFPAYGDPDRTITGKPVGVRIEYKVGFNLPLFANYVELADMSVGNIRKVNMRSLNDTEDEFSDAGHLIPIVIKQQTFKRGQSYLVRDEGATGNWGGMNLDNEAGAAGANDIRDWITNGYPGDIAVGDIRNTQPGFMKGPVLDGILSRIWEHITETWSDHPV
ncbi:MAG: TadE family protein, partial [Candidatus Hydrogenedentota bacterium]